MTDVVFNGGVLKRNLYRFRQANGFGNQFVVGDTLHEASETLRTLNINADQIIYEGQLLSAKGIK